MTGCCEPQDSPTSEWETPFAAIRAELPREAAIVRITGFDDLRRGRPSSSEAIAAAAGLEVTTVRRTLEVLVDRGAADIDSAGRVVGIGGLSLVPSRHRLILDGQRLYTWCAVDALGIPPALGVDATAHLRCTYCDRSVEIEFAAGVPTEPSAAMTWFPQCGVSSHLRRDFCADANVFCAREHLDRWRRDAGDPPGEPLSLTEVTSRGRTIWARGA